MRHEISHWKKHTTVTLSAAKFLNYTKLFKSRNIWNWLFTCFLVSEPTSCSPKCFGANLTSVTDVLLSTRELLFTWKKDSMLHFGDNARSVELGSSHAHQVSYTFSIFTFLTKTEKIQSVKKFIPKIFHATLQKSLIKCYHRTFYTLTSVEVFSTLFFKHSLRC